MTVMLDAKVAEFAPKVGTTRACSAFAVNVRSHRHRRQRDEGRLLLAPQAEPRPRRRHPAALGDDEKDRIVETLCSERFVDLAPAQVYSTLLDEGAYLCSLPAPSVSPSTTTSTSLHTGVVAKAPEAVRDAHHRHSRSAIDASLATPPGGGEPPDPAGAYLRMLNPRGLATTPVPDPPAPSPFARLSSPTPPSL